MLNPGERRVSSQDTSAGAPTVQRPVMDPIPMSPDLEGRAGRRGVIRRTLQFLLRRSTRWQQLEAVFDDGSKFWRVCRGILYRLALLPMLTMLIASALVYTRTHPSQPAVEPDPSAVGCYYQPVDMLSEDGRHLEGWLVPALSAHDVLLMHDGALHLRRPAVVLAHDFGQTQQQMLPLVRPLNEKGWVVLVVGLRGAGTATPVGQTLGLNESMDIKAAVALLRRQRFVDGSHITLVGVDRVRMRPCWPPIAIRPWPPSSSIRPRKPARTPSPRISIATTSGSPGSIHCASWPSRSDMAWMSATWTWNTINRL